MNSETLNTLLEVLAVIVLVLLNGFFVAAEFSLVKIRDTQLSGLVARGHRGAKRARHILRHLNSYLSATQLGVTVASLGLGWIGEPIFLSLLVPVLRWLGVESPNLQHSISFAVGFSVITFLHIVAGEQAPKWFAIQRPLPVSLWASRPLHWFYLASYPFNRTLNVTAQWLLRRLGIEPVNEAEIVHSEEELRVLVTTSQEQAGATALGRDIVLNALDLPRRIARDVLRPRQEIVFLSTDSSLAECLEIAEKSRYSRFPLCEQGDIDRTLGVIHIKDLYGLRLKARQGADLMAAARKLIYIPETARLEKVLQLFLERKLHFAIVVDEYGGTVGMVSLENILEELVGQIQDEFDAEKPLLHQTDDNNWDLDGALPLHELTGLTGQNLAEEGVSTVSGWVTHRLGGFPKMGDSLVLGQFTFRVEEMEDLRVARLKLTRRTDAQGVSKS